MPTMQLKPRPVHMRGLISMPAVLPIKIKQLPFQKALLAKAHPTIPSNLPEPVPSDPQAITEQSHNRLPAGQQQGAKTTLKAAHPDETLLTGELSEEEKPPIRQPQLVEDIREVQ